MSNQTPLEDRREAQVAEYGTWVATGPIFFEGALAYNEGHPVPDSNVKAYGYEKQGLVRRRDNQKKA